MVAGVAVALVLLLVGGFLLFRIVSGSGSDTADTRPGGVDEPSGDDRPGGETEPNQPSGDLRGTLHGAGASNGQVAMEIWINEVTKVYPGLTVQYEPTGSGAGREMFLSGGAQFGISDQPLTDEEMAASQCAAPPLNLPIIVNPLALVANLPGVAQLNLDAPTVADIYRGTITRWNDPAIAGLNPDAALPDVPITPLYRSDTANTNEALTEWLAATGAWDLEPSDEWPADTGEAVAGTSGMNSTIASGQGTLGYLNLAHAPDGATVVHLKSGDAFLAPDGPEAAYQLDGSPKVTGRPEHDHTRQLDHTIAGSYPVIQVSYLLVCSQYADPADGELVRGTFAGILTPEEHAKAVPDGTVALSEQMYQDLAAAIGSVS